VGSIGAGGATNTGLVPACAFVYVSCQKASFFIFYGLKKAFPRRQIGS